MTIGLELSLDSALVWQLTVTNRQNKIVNNAYMGVIVCSMINVKNTRNIIIQNYYFVKLWIILSSSSKV